MKKTLVIFYIIIGFGLSCDNNKFEPIAWSTYFVFLNQDGSDFFPLIKEYDPTRINMITNDIAFALHLDTLSSINRFRRSSALWDIQYIDYGNGDIDTLTMTWEPPEVEHVYFDKGTYFGSIDNIRYYLNGALVAEWDFKNNPGLKMEIVQRNANAFREDADFDPIVIVLPKEPDWDELD